MTLQREAIIIENIAWQARPDYIQPPNDVRSNLTQNLQVYTQQELKSRRNWNPENSIVKSMAQSYDGRQVCAERIVYIQLHSSRVYSLTKTFLQSRDTKAHDRFVDCLTGTATGVALYELPFGKLNIESICSPRYPLRCCMSTQHSYKGCTSCPPVPGSHGTELGSFCKGCKQNSQDFGSGRHSSCFVVRMAN